MRTRILAALCALTLAASGTARATYCGCDKPMPRHAAIRPLFAWTPSLTTDWPSSTGTASVPFPLVKIFGYGSELVKDRRYDVYFERLTQRGTAGVGPYLIEKPQRQPFATRPLLAQDPADYKGRDYYLAHPDEHVPSRLELRVPVPDISPGPKRVRVVDHETKKDVIVIPENSADGFTLIGKPVNLGPPPGLPTASAWKIRQKYKTGVHTSSTGEQTIFIALRVRDIRDEFLIRGQVNGMALKFSGEDISGFNTQGFFFDRLIDIQSKDPNLFYYHIDPGASLNSDDLVYWRHEFNTWQATHEKAGTNLPSPSDPQFWHADTCGPSGCVQGSPHVEFDYMIVAIKVHLRNALRLWTPDGVKMLLNLDVTRNTPNPNTGAGDANARKSRRAH